MAAKVQAACEKQLWDGKWYARGTTASAEPYSYRQFVYGKEHTAFGRARHPWLTGSAGWNYTAVTTYILGVRVGFDGLVVDPCVPKGWKGFEVQRQWRGRYLQDQGRKPQGRLEGHPVRDRQRQGRLGRDPGPGQRLGQRPGRGDGLRLPQGTPTLWLAS